MKTSIRFVLSKFFKLLSNIFLNNCHVLSVSYGLFLYPSNFLDKMSFFKNTHFESSKNTHSLQSNESNNKMMAEFPGQFSTRSRCDKCFKPSTKQTKEILYNKDRNMMRLLMNHMVINKTKKDFVCSIIEFANVGGWSRWAPPTPE